AAIGGDILPVHIFSAQHLEALPGCLARLGLFAVEGEARVGRDDAAALAVDGEQAGLVAAVVVHPVQVGVAAALDDAGQFVDRLVLDAGGDIQPQVRILGLPGQGQ